MNLPNRVSLLRALVVLVLFTGGVVHADALHPTSSEANKHLDAGKSYFRDQHWQQAVEEFKAGRAIEPAPIFDLNLAQAYRYLGNYKAAMYHYRLFLGEYTIADDYADGAKQKLAETETLLAQQQAQAKAVAPTTPPPPLAPVSRERWYHDWSAWSATGLGVASTTTGLLFLKNASDLDDQANHTPNQQDAAALHDRADTRSIVGDAFLVAGVVVTVMGIVKLAVPPDDPRAAVARCNVGVSSNGLFVFGRF